MSNFCLWISKCAAILSFWANKNRFFSPPTFICRPVPTSTTAGHAWPSAHSRLSTTPSPSNWSTTPGPNTPTEPSASRNVHVRQEGCGGDTLHWMNPIDLQFVLSLGHNPWGTTKRMRWWKMEAIHCCLQMILLCLPIHSAATCTSACFCCR